MSLCIWNNYGYGINTDKIKTDEERLKKFIESQPDVKEKLVAWEKDEDYSDSDALALGAYLNNNASELCELYQEHGDNDDVTGFAGIIQMVLSASAGFPLLACRDHNNDSCYVIVPRYFPWETNDAYFSLKSEADVKAIFEKSIAILTDQSLDELDWGEQNIENLS